jgi:hypothetical protein
MTSNEPRKPQVTIYFPAGSAGIPQSISELTEELGRESYTVAPFPLPAAGGGIVATVGPLTIVVGNWAAAFGYTTLAALGTLATAFGTSFAGTLGSNAANDVYAKLKEKLSGCNQDGAELVIKAEAPSDEVVAIEFVIDAEGNQIGEGRAVGPGGLRPPGLEP